MNIYLENQANKNGRYLECVKDVGMIKNKQVYLHLYIKLNDNQTDNLNNPLFYLNANNVIYLKDNSNIISGINNTFAKVFVYVNTNANAFTYNEQLFVGRGYFSFTNKTDLKGVFTNYETWNSRENTKVLTKELELKYEVTTPQEHFEKYRVGDLYLPNGIEFVINESSFNFNTTTMYSVNKDILTGQEWVSSSNQLTWPNYPNIPNNYETISFTGNLFSNTYVQGIYQNHLDLTNNYQHRLIIDKTLKQNILQGQKLVVESFKNGVSQNKYIKDLLEYNHGQNAHDNDNNLISHHWFSDNWTPWLKNQASNYTETNNNVKVFYVNLIKEGDNNAVEVFNNFGEKVKLYYGHKYIAQELNDGNWVIMSGNKYENNESVILDVQLQSKFRKEFL